MTFAVHVLPDDITLQAQKGQSLLEVLSTGGITVDSPCGGKGTCKKCRAMIVTAQGEEEPICACLYTIENDVTVRIPTSSRLQGQQVQLEGEMGDYTLDPMVKVCSIDLSTPTLDDPVSDSARLKIALIKQNVIADISLTALKKLPYVLRKNNFALDAFICCNEIIDVAAQGTEHLGLAVDVGTTTIAVVLVDLTTGKLIARVGCYNGQSVYGSDVISRIVHADNGENERKQLQSAVIGSINNLIAELERTKGISGQNIRSVVIAGNTVMMHLLYDVSAEFLRLEPYVPAATEFAKATAGELGINVFSNAKVACVPSVASYVGGDITAGVVACKMQETSALTLFIDVGTNGEMVLGNGEWLMTCSCSAGPAFEGSGISCGMRAMDGAIFSIDLTGEEITSKTIGNKPPVGICGTGLINALSMLYANGFLDRSGRFTKKANNHLKEVDGAKAFVLCKTNNEIYLSENDIENLIRAKAAIFAGVTTMIRLIGLQMGDIEQVILAGGFGAFIDIADAISIGMLPKLDLEKYRYVGNSSLQGALALLLDGSQLPQYIELASSMTYIELSLGNTFMEEFISASFIPHTDINLFT